MLTTWVRFALCVVSLLVPTWALAQERVCICPQDKLWDVDENTSAYWAYRYSRPEGDMDCTDDAVEPILHYDTPTLNPVPAAYCVSSNRCGQCITLGPGVHLPETEYSPVAWNAAHGLRGGWTLIRTSYLQFNTKKDGPTRYAKLFLLNHDATKMMFGYGIEIDRLPDPEQVDSAMIIKVGPNRCPPLRAYYANGTVVGTRDSTTARRVAIGNVFYIVRTSTDAGLESRTNRANSEKDKETSVKIEESPAKAAKKTCCGGITITEDNSVRVSGK